MFAKVTASKEPINLCLLQLTRCEFMRDYYRQKMTVRLGSEGWEEESVGSTDLPGKKRL